MFAGFFLPTFTWFFYLCSMVICSYSQYTYNPYYILLIVPVGFIDNYFYVHYYGDDDE